MKKIIFIIISFALSTVLQAQQTINHYIDLKSNGINSTEILMRKLNNENYYSLFSNNTGFGVSNSSSNKTSFFINYADNVGIGTEEPLQKLDVRGNAIINGALISTVANLNIGGIIQIDNPAKTTSGTANSWKIYNMGGAYGNSLQFWAYDVLGCDGGMCANKFTLMDNGNVGVGTVNPQEKLTVAGTIGAREIKVSTNAGADFVFEPGYKLTDLTELEKFLKTNKHLPEIPTAKQMIDNGVNLGELNIKLLQKVEELTLHLIDKDKELKNEASLIKNQQVQINELKKGYLELKQYLLEEHKARK